MTDECFLCNGTGRDEGHFTGQCMHCNGTGEVDVVDEDDYTRDDDDDDE